MMQRLFADAKPFVPGRKVHRLKKRGPSVRQQNATNAVRRIANKHRREAENANSQLEKTVKLVALVKQLKAPKVADDFVAKVNKKTKKIAYAAAASAVVQVPQNQTERLLARIEELEKRQKEFEQKTKLGFEVVTKSRRSSDKISSVPGPSERPTPPVRSKPFVMTKKPDPEYCPDCKEKFHPNQTCAFARQYRQLERENPYVPPEVYPSNTWSKSDKRFYGPH